MEPFGLFEFLRSLLSAPAPQAPSEPQEPAPRPDPAPVAPSAADTQTDEEQTSPAREAIESFLCAHEQRARRIKK